MVNVPIDQVANLLGAVDGPYREDRRESFDMVLKSLARRFSM